MYVHYFYWQYIAAPRWLLILFWNLERALLRFFSVGLMLKTLFAHWHKDRVSYRQGSISGFLTALAWNLISRGIGFIVRIIVLAAWLIIQSLYIIAASASFIAFLAWPLAVITAFAIGLGLILTG